MKWHAGQQVIALKNTNTLRNGEIYTINSIMPLKCGCDVCLDVGIKSPYHADFVCLKCKNYHHTQCFDDIIWFADWLFSPLADINELQEILNKQPENAKEHDFKP